MLSTTSIRQRFPILKTTINCYPLIYFDNAATTQKPQSVIKALTDFYSKYNANVHRGHHFLSNKATELYENTRNKILDFLGAYGKGTVVFTKNATEALNLIAWSLFYEYIKLPATVAGGGSKTQGKLILDPKKALIITSIAEHHSNFLPWLRLHKDFKIPLKTVGILKSGEVDYSQIEKYLKDSKASIKVISINHVSNVLGSINNLEKLSQIADKYKAILIIDAAQSIAHIPIDLSKLKIDALAFSGHKMYGPLGIGGLYISNKIIDKLSPFLLGGGMINRVSLDNFTTLPPPEGLEAGTPSVADAYGLLKAVEFLEEVGLKNIMKHEKKLIQYALERLLKHEEEIGVLGALDADNKSSVISFVIKETRLTELAEFMDQNGIAIRVGHHCAEPLHKHFNITASARISFAVYNTMQELETFFEVLEDFLFKQGY